MLSLAAFIGSKCRQLADVCMHVSGFCQSVGQCAASVSDEWCLLSVLSVHSCLSQVYLRLHSESNEDYVSGSE